MSRPDTIVMVCSGSGEFMYICGIDEASAKLKAEDTYGMPWWKIKKKWPSIKLVTLQVEEL